MKKYQLLTRVLFLILTLLSVKTHIAQPNTVSITTTVESDHSSWSPGNALPLCSGNSLIKVMISNNSGQTLNGFVIQELPGEIIPVASLATVQAGCDIGLDDHPLGLSLHIVNLPTNSICEVTIPFYIECASVTQNTTLSIQYSAISPLQVNASVIQFQIAKPQMLMTNFIRHDGVPMPNETVIQQLPISNESNRGFDLLVSNGIIEEFDFDYNVEAELEFIRFEVASFYSNGNPTGLTTTIYNNFQGSGGLIDLLFPAGYMVAGNFIRVTEFFIVNNCSPTINDATQYNLIWNCHNNAQCDNFFAQRYVFVGAALTGVPPHLGISPSLDICGQTPSTITITFTNPTPNANQGYLTSGGKRIERVIFPIDLDWITYGSIWLVDANCPTCETDITSAPYFVIDNVTKRCTLNVSAIPAGVQIPPFQDLYLTDNIFHELAEGSGFRIQFRNAVFQCNAGEFYNNAGAFTTCRNNAGGFMLFGPSSNTHFRVEYQNMCNMLSNTAQNANYEYANYGNSFPMTMLAEANPTDVVEYDSPNATVNFFYSYAGSNPSPSPFLFNAAISPQYPFFNCDTLTYHAVLSIPEVFDLNLTSTGTEYYSNPNDLSSFVNLTPILVGTMSEGGVNYNQYRINNIDYNGLIRISLSLNNGNCPTDSGGLAELRMELRSVCNECDSCAYTVRCVRTSIFYHCDGDCDAPVGTDEYSFNFNRTTLGWTDSSLTTFVTPSPSLSFNRTYSCDRIEVSADGVISGTANIDDAFFLIDYFSDTNFQFYDYVDGTGTFSFIAVDNTPISDDIISLSDLTGFAGNCSVCSLRVYIDPLKVQELISHGGGQVSFNAVFAIKEMPLATTPPDGFYPMPQVRGQFVGQMGNNLYYSCDSWGDNMTVIKVRTVRGASQGILCDGYANGGESMSDQGLCNRWFYISTSVLGGMIGLNEFPNEFRPITLWPATGSSNFIELQLPAGFSFSGNSSFANSQNVWLNVDTEMISGNTIRFKGLTGINDWPIVEHDGSTIRHRLKGVLNNDCPPTTTPAPATLTFPYVRRGFAVDDIACQQNIVETNVYDNISVSTYSLELLTTAVGGITLTSIDGSVGGFTMRFADQAGCAGEVASPLQNAWILNQSNGINITSIVKDGGTPIFPNALGYFEIGSMNHGQIYQIIANYEITDCTNPNFDLHYGFACLGYDSLANYACGVNELEVPVIIAESEFEMVVQPPANSSGSPCDDYTYIVTLNSTSEADVEDIELILNMNSSFSIVSATYAMTLGGNQLILPFSINCSGQSCQYVFDVNMAAFGSNGMPPASSSNSTVYLFITVQGDCDLHGTIQELIYGASATDICGVSIYPDNNNVELLLDFPISIPLENGCLSNCNSDCSPEFQITQLSNCCFLFEDLTPDVIPCEIGGWGIFQNGNWVATYLDTASFEHCFVDEGVYLVCNTVCCDDGSIEKVCYEVEVWGSCDPVCEEFLIDVESSSCNEYSFTAVLPAGIDSTINYCWWVGYDNQVLCDNTGSFSHQYPPGSYLVCYTVWYIDPITNQQKDCKVCTQIEVNCEPTCEGFSLEIADQKDCEYTFEAVAPANLNGTITGYCWWIGYDNIVDCPGNSTMTHSYSPGTYEVCYTIYYTDWYSNETVECKICRIINVDCEDKKALYCAVIEQEDFRDEARAIIKHDEGNIALASALMRNTDSPDFFTTVVADNLSSPLGLKVGELIGDPEHLDVPNSIVRKDKRIYTTGHTTSKETGNTDVYITCIDEELGVLLWAYKYGTPGTDIGVKILDMMNEQNELLVVGHTNLKKNGTNYDVFAMKITTNGNFQDLQVYSPVEKNKNEFATDAIKLSEKSDFVISGYQSAENRDMLALKISGNLQPLTDMAFIGNDNNEVTNGLVQNGTHVYLAGYSDEIAQENHIYIAEFKASSLEPTGANAILINEAGTTEATKINLDYDGQFILSGIWYDGQGLSQGLAQKLSSNKTENLFSPLWTSITQTELGARFNHLVSSSETELVYAGSFSKSDVDDDIFLVKVDSKTGESCCMKSIEMVKESNLSYEMIPIDKAKKVWTPVDYGKEYKYYDVKIVCEEKASAKNTADLNTYDAGFVVYPNPNAGSFVVQLNDLNNQFKSVQLLDVSGRLISAKSFGVQNPGQTLVEFNVSELNSGIYMIRVEGHLGVKTGMVSIMK